MSRNRESRILTADSVDRIKQEVESSVILRPEHKKVLLALIDSHEAARETVLFYRDRSASLTRNQSTAQRDDDDR
jgi:hypothetical protein